MKKIFALIFAIILIVAINSCKKEEQSRFDKITILEKTGEKIRSMEDYIDSHRANTDPSGYSELATYCTNEVIIVLKKELKPDTFRSNSGDIAAMIGAYDKYWRDKHPKYQSKVWKRLKIGVNDDVYRVCEAYSEKLLPKSRSYIAGIINGSMEYTDGCRVDWMEDQLRDLITSDPDVEWQYRDRLYSYFKSFAENPNNKAKFKRHGLLDFGWFD